MLNILAWQRKAKVKKLLFVFIRSSLWGRIYLKFSGSAILLAARRPYLKKKLFASSYTELIRPSFRPSIRQSAPDYLWPFSSWDFYRLWPLCQMVVGCCSACPQHTQADRHAGTRARRQAVSPAHACAQYALCPESRGLIKIPPFLRSFLSLR